MDKEVTLISVQFSSLQFEWDMADLPPSAQIGFWSQQDRVSLFSDRLDAIYFNILRGEMAIYCFDEKINTPVMCFSV